MRRAALAGAIVVMAALGVAQAASASWLEQITPNPAGARVWELGGVSCTSATACTAVGDVLDNTGTHPFAERRSGDTWTIQTISAPATGSLDAVSCASSTACTAVGDTSNGGNTVTLAEGWNGSSWTLESTPNPGGATTSQLRGVSCAGPTACIAVGSSSDGVHPRVLAESWNGSSWSLQSVPQPAGSVNSELNGVTCTSTTSCVAVGDFFDGTSTKPLAETWNGTSWSIRTTPNPPGTSNALEGVSCSSATACTAVGAGFAERFDGAAWSLQTLAPVPHGDTPALLSGVSCASQTSCVAVGAFFNHEAIETLVAEVWNGTSWKFQPTPLISVNDSSLLDAVSCTGPTDCTASGSVHNPVTGNRAAIEVLALRWQLQSPVPPNGAIASNLDAVSCTAAKACQAIGNLEADGSTFATFAEGWDGKSWTEEATPNATVSNLSGVSCTDATACTAVGDFDNGGTIQTLAERWDGTGWTILPTPNPTGAVRSFLLGVSCSSATACTAVGFFVASNGSQLPLAEAWNGTAWAIQTTPKPAGATMVQLNGVSCASASACAAVGSGGIGGRTEMLAEIWNGTSWTIKNTPDPPGGSDSFLAGVSCTAATACTAAGNVFDGTNTVPLVERWNGSAWSSQSIPAPPGATATNLAGASCAAAKSCVVVGSFLPGSGPRATVAERWNGTSWSIQPTPNPTGAQSSLPSGVSCASQQACMAVGTFTDGSGIEEPLAEQYS
jgi:hypothetical protein